MVYYKIRRIRRRKYGKISYEHRQIRIDMAEWLALKLIKSLKRQKVFPIRYFEHDGYVEVFAGEEV